MSQVQKTDQAKDVPQNQGTTAAISSFIDPSLNWDDIEWLMSITQMDIVLKGIQCAADAVMAKRMGVKGIVVSNHGGRQIDTARSGIEILPEVIELASVGRSAYISVGSSAYWYVRSAAYKR